jgi:hypothetical protein
MVLLMASTVVLVAALPAAELPFLVVVSAWAFTAKTAANTTHTTKH